MPGVNAPNVAGAPSVSASVAGTEPPTAPSFCRPDQEALRLHRGLVALDVGREPLDVGHAELGERQHLAEPRGRWALYVGEASVGVEPSVV